MARPGPPEKNMVKTTATIAPEVYERLKEIAAEDGTNVRTVIREAVEAHLKKRQPRRRPR